jgi:hypothetical protein
MTTVEEKDALRKQEIHLDPALFTPKKIDLSQAFYEIDALQNELLKFYLRADPRFKRAFYTDFTSMFLQFLKDKARLEEPVHISIMGNTRSGKSSIGMTLTGYLMALYGKKLTISQICANVFEFLETLQNTPLEETKNTCYQVDEEKQSIYGVGSVAKKMKVSDVQNIIAINNISTIMLNPTGWANKESNYGLRIFGRCFKTRTCRAMLYNLMEKGSGGELPLGMIYLPIFTEVLPYGKELEADYLKKKQIWVNREQQGSGDVLFDLKRKTAEKFCKDPRYMGIKHKLERLTYIGTIMGSEWTKGEIEEIESLTKLIKEGYLDDRTEKKDEQD